MGRTLCTRADAVLVFSLSGLCSTLSVRAFPLGRVTIEITPHCDCDCDEDSVSHFIM